MSGQYNVPPLDVPWSLYKIPEFLRVGRKIDVHGDVVRNDTGCWWFGTHEDDDE
jgi:hypothetical protein